MALSTKQLEMLKGMEGIDQRLVAAYEQGGQNLSPEDRAYVESKAPSEIRLKEIASKPFVSVGNRQAIGGSAPSIVTQSAAGGKVESGGLEVDPQEAVDRITNFNKALNVGIDLARKQRQDTVLDLVGGFAPEGALPASSFASVLNAFHSSSRPLEASLLKSATDFAQDQEESATETKSQIRDLALAVIEAGGDQATMNAVLSFTESGDLNGAIKAAGAALEAGADDIRQVGSNLLKVSPDGTYEVIFSGGSSTSSKTSDEESPELEENQVLRDLPFGAQGAPTEVTTLDFFKASGKEVEAEMNKLLGDSSANIKKALTAELQRDFMNDWVFMMEKGGEFIEPIDYFNEVWGPAAGIELEKKKETEKEDDGKRSPLGEV